MHGKFLQSEKWEKFQRGLGNQTVRVEGALFIRYPLKLGLTYLYCPRPSKIPGLEVIKKTVQKSDVFVWIDSASDFTKDLITKYPKQPKNTIILDLSKSEDELLAQMRQKTRYNIRLAQRHNVNVKCQNSNVKTEFEIFWNLIQETNKRDNIRSHSKEHYQKLIEIAGAELFIAYYQNTPVAVAICIADSDCYYYLHGASTHKHKNVMAPYLLQWEMIRHAKEQGYKYYDFWGVDERKYPGVTRFKLGFVTNTPITTYPDATLTTLNKFWFKVYNILK